MGNQDMEKEGNRAEVLHRLPTPTSSEIQPALRNAGEEVVFLSLPPAALPSSPKHSRQSAAMGHRRMIQQKPPAKQRRGGDSARRTAHSAIERQRRNKMNACFHTLKEMIPACRGQELHKLSILQSSIEYMQSLIQSKQTSEKGQGRGQGKGEDSEAGKALLLLHHRGMSVKDLLE